MNGTVSPFLEVEQRQYRFRMLNACSSRFLNPRLVYAQANAPTEPSPNVAGPAFIQIGTEGGFLSAPAMVNGPKQPILLMAPAERADLIVDFSAVPAGSTLILYNDAPGPFPGGAPETDYYPGNRMTPSSVPGFSPNTRTLLQVRVKARTGPADPLIKLPAKFTPTDPFLVPQTPGVPFTYTAKTAPGAATGKTTIKIGSGPTAPKVEATIRYLTLNEGFDEHGRLAQFLGTNQPTNPGAKALSFSRAYHDSPTEVIPAGSYEIWEIANLSADTHPIHIHLANAQILFRQAFNVNGYAGGVPNYKGSPVGPDANECGWKETARMNPGEVTSLLMHFVLPAVPFTVPASPRIGGHEYVWHCHILEHEEHDMMRPLIVI